MALAVKTTPETITRSPHQQRVISSLAGALYVLFSFGLIFAGLPMLWRALDLANVFNNEFLADALLLLVTLPAIVGLVLLGKKLEGPHPVRGARAGAFIQAFLIFLAGLTTLGIGNNWLVPADMPPAVGAVVTLMVGIGLAALLGWMFTRPGFGQWLVRVEEAGWFHATSFKPNQGLRVRRGTLIGLLVVGVCGIITLVQHRSLSAGAWEVVLPFTDTGTHVRVLPIMFHVEMTLPILLAVGLVWFCWRTVNWPAFADFLIATEAEMNKVSWTTRKRLYQDTIVVLVAVVLMTTFLFVVDIIWIKALNFTGVLNVDLQEERAKQNAPTQW